MQRLSALFIALAACTQPSAGDGLTLDTFEPGHVAGTFARDGVAVAFDFARTGTHQVMAFHALDGRPLLVTTLDGPSQTTDILGGRLVVSGITNTPNPTIVGDRDAQDELLALPEARLQEPLHAALVAAGVDAALYEPQQPEVANLSNYDGRYFAFSPGDYNTWITAGGASPTYVYVKNPWPQGQCAAIKLYHPWGTQDLVVDAWQSTYTTLYWWGALLDVYKYAYKVDEYGNRHCTPAVLLVRVSPYWWSP